MKLYIKTDLLKAGQFGVDTPKEDQTRAEYDSSYARRYEGVASGEAYDPDDPEVGGKYAHSDEDSALSAAEETASERSKKSKKDGITKSDFFAVLPDEDERPINKSLSILKSVSGIVEDLQWTPNQVEVDFLVDQGYAENDVRKGLVPITPRMRGLFTDWLCAKIPASPNDILRRKS